MFLIVASLAAFSMATVLVQSLFYYANSNNRGLQRKINDNNNKYKRCELQIATLVHFHVVYTTFWAITRRMCFLCAAKNVNTLKLSAFKKVPIINPWLKHLFEKQLTAAILKWKFLSFFFISNTHSRDAFVFIQHLKSCSCCQNIWTTPYIMNTIVNHTHTVWLHIYWQKGVLFACFTLKRTA